MMHEELLERVRQAWGGKLPKVLVGAPHYDGKDYVIERYAERVKELTYPNYDICLADNSSEQKHTKKLSSLGIPSIYTGHQETARMRLTVARNELRKKVLDEGYDFLFDLETDVIPRTDIIEQLLQWGKKTIGGWYYVGGFGNARPCIGRPWTEYGAEESQERLSLYGLMNRNRLMRVFLGSLGVTMLHRDTLKKVKFKCFPKVLDHFDDTFFFNNCEQRGIPVYVDTDMLCPHFQSDWDEVEDK